VRALPFHDVTYQIAIVDSNGCEAGDSISVNVISDDEVFIPNAFSPNRDGINNCTQIFMGKDVEEILTFVVFTRWGEIIFEANNFYQMLTMVNGTVSTEVIFYHRKCSFIQQLLDSKMAKRNYLVEIYNTDEINSAFAFYFAICP